MANPKQPNKAEERRYLRFTLAHRLEHWLFVSSFVTLAVSGLSQKFATSPLAQFIIKTLGGVEQTRLIHHSAAVVMGLVAIYHLGAVGYRLFVLRLRPTLLPSISDIRAALQTLRYNFGFSQNPPQQGRYTFEEKLEYWAVVWGTLIMGLTGFLMWNPIAATNILPGEAIPAAKTAHGLEAILAVLSIILWHFYHVLIRTFNKSMFIGTLTEEQMLHEHPLELADIKAGLAHSRTTPEEVRRARRKFLPTYGVIAAALVSGLIYFVTFEETAVAVVPPVSTVEVFVPLTPTPYPTPRPTPTALPIAATTWEGGIANLLANRCGGCHNSSARIGGLDLTTYESLLRGGNSGAAVIPGNADASLIFLVQSRGDHPGQLTIDELALIRDWILAGAP